jgi:hypothetical protein
VAIAPHGHQLDRALNAKTTLLCVLAGCLFPARATTGSCASPSACPAWTSSQAPRSPSAWRCRRPWRC